jgi:hypothetical protein
MSEKGKVIIAHGLFLSEKFMRPMKKRLNNLGWDTSIIDYCTVNISEDEVFSKIDDLLPSNNKTPVNFIGHSLGGLMIRHYFNEKNPDINGKVVTMGTPHQTADIGRLLYDFNIGHIIGNSSSYGIIDKLQPDKWLHKNKIGNIAGRIRLGIQLINPRASGFTHDGTILEKETYLEGQSDNITLNVSHTSMIFSKDTVRQADYFLSNGCFDKSSDSKLL